MCSPTVVNLKLLGGEGIDWNMHFYTSALLSLLHPKIVLENSTEVFS